MHLWFTRIRTITPAINGSEPSAGDSNPERPRYESVQPVHMLAQPAEGPLRSHHRIRSRKREPIASPTLDRLAVPLWLVYDAYTIYAEAFRGSHPDLIEEVQRGLRALSRRTGQSESELIRAAIDVFLTEQRGSDRIELLRQARGVWGERTDGTSQRFAVSWIESARDRRNERAAAARHGCARRLPPREP